MKVRVRPVRLPQDNQSSFAAHKSNPEEQENCLPSVLERCQPGATGAWLINSSNRLIKSDGETDGVRRGRFSLCKYKSCAVLFKAAQWPLVFVFGQKKDENSSQCGWRRRNAPRRRASKSGGFLCRSMDEAHHSLLIIWHNLIHYL